MKLPYLKEDLKVNIEFFCQISEQSLKTQQTINDTAQQFKNLDNNFKALQTEFLKNSADAMKVEEELKLVAADVDETQKKSTELTLDYRQVAAELDKKAMNSTEAHKNAETLLEKASQLSLNTMNKVKDLNGKFRVITMKQNFVCYD